MSILLSSYDAGSDMAVTAESVSEKLGGRRVFERPVRTDVELADVIRGGFPAAVLDHLVAAVPGAGVLAMYRLLGSPRTLQRKRTAGSALSADESDRAARVARMVARAEEALGDAGRAHRWLQQPNRSLGGRTPLELLDSDPGSRSVERVLLRIEHGIVG